MPDCFSLKSNPLCHTLSSSLLISQKQPLFPSDYLKHFQIRYHLLQNDILTRNQSGFAKGDSAVNLLVNISNEFGNVLDSRKEIRVVFGISVRSSPALIDNQSEFEPFIATLWDLPHK
jgi:hypothetical protein